MMKPPSIMSQYDLFIILFYIYYNFINLGDFFLNKQRLKSFPLTTFNIISPVMPKNNVWEEK